MQSGKYKKKNLIFEKVPVQTDSSFAVERVTAPNITCAYHYHPEPELTFIASGSGRVLIGTEWLTFSSGDLSLIGSNVPHLYAYVPDAIHWDEADVIKITQNFVHGPLACIPEFSAIRRLFHQANTGIVFQRTPELGRVFKQILNSAGAKRFLQVCRLLQYLSDQPFRSLNASGELILQSQQYDQKQIESAVRYLQQNFKRKINLADVASELRMEPESFRKFFKKSIRMSFTDYLLELRLAMACRLLQETSYSILDIAETSGFFNLSNFNRIFRARRGVSPKEYRKL